jgi:hypothetical protein
MREFPIKTSDYNRAKKQREYDTRLSTEWDLSFKIFDDTTLQALVYDATESTELDNVVYVLIGGIERAVRGSQYVKTPTNGGEPFEHQFHDHVHAALIVKSPITRTQALQYYGWTSKTGAYCAPRQTKWPYLTWKYHHTKGTSKVNDAHKVFEYGVLPEDDITDETTVKNLLKFGKQFASADEWADLLTKLNIHRKIKREARNADRDTKKQLKLIEVKEEKREKREEKKRKRIESQQVRPKRRVGEDPDKVRARYDNYKELLVIATANGDVAGVEKHTRNIGLLEQKLDLME